MSTTCDCAMNESQNNTAAFVHNKNLKNQRFDDLNEYYLSEAGITRRQPLSR